MTAIQVEDEVEIRLPPAEVFAFVGDHEHLPAWKAGVTRVSRTSPGPVGVGTTYRVVGRVLGRLIEATYELTAYAQDEMFSGRLLSHVISLDETYRFEADGPCTLVRVTVKARPVGRIRHLRPLLGPVLCRQVRADHRRLKAMLERTRPPVAEPPDEHGVQATEAEHGVQATQADEDVQATQADDDVQATQSDDGVQATQSDDGVEVAQAPEDDRVQATQGGDIHREELAEDGTPRA